MWILWIICILIGVVLLYPYVSVILSRKKAIKHLCGVVRRGGGRVRRLHRFVSLSHNRAPRYDLLVAKGDTLYAVKLWSAKRRGVDLLISSDGTVAEQREDRDPLSPKGKARERILRSAFYTVPKTRENFTVPEGKRVVHILLVYPSYRSVMGYRHMQWVELQSGDRVFDKILYSPSAFEKHLLEA